MKRIEFKVRRNALLLREFTFAQLVRATGLSPGSVRTEVWKLKQEGFITSEPKPGQREALYRLSHDPEKRLALSRAVEAFYPEPPEPIPPRPTSRLYQAALQSLDQAEGAEGERRDELLARVACQLEGAWQAEGASSAPELVQAHILRERGRLARLEGRHKQARELFDQAGEKFVAAGLMGQNLENEPDHYVSFKRKLPEKDWSSRWTRELLTEHLRYAGAIGIKDGNFYSFIPLTVEDALGILAPDEIYITVHCPPDHVGELWGQQIIKRMASFNKKAIHWTLPKTK